MCKSRISIRDHLALFEWVLNPMTRFLIRDRREKTATQRTRPWEERQNESHATQAKDHTVLPGTARGQENSPLESSEGVWLH